MEHHADVTELRESHDVATDPPDLRVRLTRAHGVAALALEARATRELLEPALEGCIDLDEYLCADVPRHVGEPRELRAKLRELIDLVDRRRVDALVSWARKSHEALLQREVPEEPLRVLPTPQSIVLFGRDVSAVAEALAEEHVFIYILASGSRKRFSHGSPRRLLAHGTLGLRTEIQEKSDLGESVRDPEIVVGIGLRRLWSRVA